MADKKSIAEAVAMIRKQKRIVKKSIAGIGRIFDVSTKPETKALVSAEGTAVMNQLQPLRRKLRLAKSKAEPVEEKKEEPVEEKKAEPVEEKKAESIKDPVVKVEKKPAKYRVKRNTMIMSL